MTSDRRLALPWVLAVLDAYRVIAVLGEEGEPEIAIEIAHRDRLGDQSWHEVARYGETAARFTSILETALLVLVEEHEGGTWERDAARAHVVAAAGHFRPVPNPPEADYKHEPTPWPGVCTIPHPGDCADEGEEAPRCPRDAEPEGDGPAYCRACPWFLPSASGG
jgi:hypothetical protein